MRTLALTCALTTRQVFTKGATRKCDYPGCAAQWHPACALGAEWWPDETEWLPEERGWRAGPPFAVLRTSRGLECREHYPEAWAAGTEASAKGFKFHPRGVE